MKPVRRVRETYSRKLKRLCSTEERFMALVEKSKDGCWVWTASKDYKGYGRFFYKKRPWLAHRISLKLHGVRLNSNLTVDHLCRNRLCVKPKHLEQVTMRENNRRGLKGVLRTHCKQGHKLTKQNTYIWKCGRVCKLCKHFMAVKKWKEQRR